jgi:hypothetical protein
MTASSQRSLFPSNSLPLFGQDQAGVPDYDATMRHLAEKRERVLAKRA